jgi:hypothetical protein
MKERIFGTFKMLAIGVWESPPIELLTAALVVPVTIAGSLWVMQWISPLLTMVGCFAGVVFGVTAIVKMACLWGGNT